MGQEQKKYHITDDGKIFSVAEDGSVTEIGNVSEIENTPLVEPIIEFEEKGSFKSQNWKIIVSIVIFLLIVVSAPLLMFIISIIVDLHCLFWGMSNNDFWFFYFN